MSDTVLPKATGEDIGSEAKFPGVELAYDIAIDSFESMIRRVDAMNARLQTMLAFAATTTAVVPTAAKATGVSFRSWWLYFALAAFVAQLGIGMVGLSVGRLALIDPAIIYKKWLHKSTWQFKKDLVYFAGKAFAQNYHLIRRRWRLTIAMTACFFLEVALLIGWIARAHG